MLMHSTRSETPPDPWQSRKCKTYRSHTSGEGHKAEDKLPSADILIRIIDPCSLPAPAAREY